MIKSETSEIGDLELYRMLSDKTRLKILKILSENDTNVSDLVLTTGASQTLVSHKLRDLRENGVVVSFRSGKNIIYRLSDNAIKEVLNTGETAGKRISAICNCVECEDDSA